MNGREHHGFILLSAILPFAAVLTGIVLLWNEAVGWRDMVVLGVMYAVAAGGVSVGYHRLLAHRAFKTSRPIRFLLVAGGAMAGQGPPLIWTAHHRRHHRLADKPGDPHSPYQDEEPGFRGAMKGLWHSHFGWLLDKDLTSDPLRYCPDIARDPDMRFLSRHFVAVVATGMLIPGVLGFALRPDLIGFLTGVLWGGLIRFFLVNHITYSVNSIGHYFGARRFPTPDESRNVRWLALLSFGESWHNNHHAFPRSASHGMRWYEIDISAMFIRTLAALGLASDLVVIDREIQDRRAKAPTPDGRLKRREDLGRAAPAAPQAPLAERPKTAVSALDVE